MKKQNRLALTALILSASLLAHTVQAQTMKSDTLLKAAPDFMFSRDQHMNMMMSGSEVEIAAVPGERLISRSVAGRAATLVYSGRNAGTIFTYYDQAIRAEGWTTTAMDGHMLPGAMAHPADGGMKPGDTMAKPTDTMARSGDTMTGTASTMMSGSHSATFAMGGHTIDLLVREAGGRVTVTFQSK